MFHDFEIRMGQNFEKQTKELKNFTIEQAEELTRMVATSVAIPMNHNLELIGERLNISNRMVFKKPAKKYKTK